MAITSGPSGVIATTFKKVTRTVFFDQVVVRENSRRFFSVNALFYESHPLTLEPMEFIHLHHLLDKTIGCRNKLQ